jgi:hypothetical protein
MCDKKPKYKVDQIVSCAGKPCNITSIHLFGNFFIYDLRDEYGTEYSGVWEDDIEEI